MDNLWYPLQRLEALEHRDLLSSVAVVGFELPAEPEHLIDDSILVARHADFNGDGRLDVVIGTKDSEMVFYVSRGKGYERSRLPTSAAVNGLEVSDVNNDGLPDVLLATDHDASIWVNLGDGTQGWEGVSHWTTLEADAQSLAAGDLNSDGVTDLVVGGVGRAFVALLASDGGVTDVVEYPLEPGPTLVAIGNVLGDDSPDVVAVGRTNVRAPRFGFVNALENDGTGRLEALPVEGNLSRNHANESIRLADVNADGLVDLVLGQSVSGFDRWGEVSIRLGVVNGGFAAPVSYSTHGRPVSIVLGDVTMDGIVDIVVAHEKPLLHGPHYHSGLAVLIGQPRGGFGPVTSIDFGYFVSVALADENSDGSLDVIAVGGEYQGTSFERSTYHSVETSQDAFTAVSRMPLALGSEGLVDDLNEDGWPDVIGVDGASQVFRLYLGRPDGTFEALPEIPFAAEAHTQFAFSGPAGVFVEDFNDDGAKDVLVRARVELEPEQLMILMSTGGVDPAFLPAVSIPCEGRCPHRRGTTLGATQVRGDFDGDQREDTYSVERSGRAIFLDSLAKPGVRLIFSATTWDSPIGENLFDAVALDADQDGDDDLILTYSNGVLVVTDGAFPGDFNGDRIIDVEDVDQLYAALRTPVQSGDSVQFDLYRDGILNSADVDSLLRVRAGMNTADLNLDGNVNFEDFLILAKNFGSAALRWSHGDLDLDGWVGFSDFGILVANFGAA